MGWTGIDFCVKREDSEPGHSANQKLWIFLQQTKHKRNNILWDLILPAYFIAILFSGNQQAKRTFKFTTELKNS